MVAEDFFSVVNQFQWTNYIGVEDFADKLSFNFSTAIFIFCIIISTVRSYLSTAIACYIPIKPSGKNFDGFLENYCWVHGTIPIRDSELLPSKNNGWVKLDDKRIVYYQWIPFILAVQCVLFYLPKLLWSFLTYNNIGIDIDSIVKQAKSATSNERSKRDECCREVAEIIEQQFFNSREYAWGRKAKARETVSKFCPCLWPSKRTGSYLFMHYLFIKLLYMGNAIGQLFLMRKFLGFESGSEVDQNKVLHKDHGHWFGATILIDLISGKGWRETLVFPRVTYCLTPYVQMVGTQSRFIAQCSLPVNMLNEKIYIFLWFWTIFVAVMTGLSIPIWLYRLLLINSERQFVKKFLKIHELEDDARDKQRIKMFINEFLRKDGMFIMRILKMNSGDLATSRIILELWRIYNDKYFKKVNLNRGNSLPPRYSGKPSEVPTSPEMTFDHEENKYDELRKEAESIQI